MNYTYSKPYYEKWQAILDNAYTLWFNQGFAFYSLQKYDLALKSFQKSARIANLENTREFIGWCLVGSQKYQEAETAFTELVNNGPRDTLSLYGLGLAERGLGNNAEARKHLEQFLQDHRPEYEGSIPQVRSILDELNKKI